MNGFLAGTGGVEIDVFEYFDGKRLAADVGRDTGAEIDRDHIVGRSLIRCQHLECALDPGCRRTIEVEIAIDPVDSTHSSEFSEPSIEGFADAAEFRVSRIAQGQDGIGDALKTRRRWAHQVGISPCGARGRFAFAPGRGNHHKAALLREVGNLEVSEIDDPGLEAAFLGELGHILSQPLRIAGLAGKEDCQGLCRTRWRIDTGKRDLACIDTGEKAGEPRTLDRRSRTQDAIEAKPVVVTERSRLRKKS